MSGLLGTFEQIVLLTVASLGEDAYGRSVLHAAQQAVAGNRTLSAGAIYTTLDRMEAKGYLSSFLAEGTTERGGRPRRYYRLTGDGAAALRETRRTLDTLWKGQRHILNPA
ncbi:MULTISPECIES: helix-turn-helix transcriptional regulator [Acidobacterium]|uniref:Transcriptional regulator, PadR family n=1 Tax=Acidobacterium capsulatum (strain ATCC 51196 / DSM 11244 / BCRC 80197 / JCM 7670 / NBRC 15755 / NCIMB 13165 / 161) TaxID=240015 RepID=C1F8Q8_ACIC5|nr:MULTISPECIES: helix-turn-helix transcriptional regulator [Acidobacterium]ACO32787.1 transcriptional regulator, PadR family [Acidobacterium capsulatum ATCC 51196]HCT61560.1 PadR family transcriptional regulator [Acidobacterium sp.]